jgi:hypothetical protein
MASFLQKDDHDHPTRAMTSGGTGPLYYPPAYLTIYLGVHIDTICNNAIVNAPHQNHCAHFVCHLMRWHQIPGAVKCSLMSATDRNPLCQCRLRQRPLET